MRGRPDLAHGGRRRSPAREVVYAGSEHIRDVLDEVSATPSASRSCRRASTSTSSGPRRATRRSPRCSRRRGRSAESGEREERLPDGGDAARLRGVLRGRRADRPLLREADREQGRPGAARGARGLDARAVVVGFGDYRERARGARAAGHALHRPARAPPSRASAAALRRRRSCRRSSPRRSGWSRPRRRPPACRRSSPRTRASPRSRPGSRRSTRRSCADAPVVPRPATRRRSRERSRDLLALPAADARSCAGSPRAARSSGAGAGRRRRRACSRRPIVTRFAVGDEQRSATRSCSRSRARASRRARFHASPWRRSSRFSTPTTLDLRTASRSSRRPRGH